MGRLLCVRASDYLSGVGIARDIMAMHASPVTEQQSHQSREFRALQGPFVVVQRAEALADFPGPPRGIYVYSSRYKLGPCGSASGVLTIRVNAT